MSDPDDPLATRRKRLRMRAWRRGTKEMDLILGPYADAHLPAMSAAALDSFEALMEENDQELYQWVAGREGAPASFAPLLAEIGAHARARLVPGA